MFVYYFINNIYNTLKFLINIDYCRFNKGFSYY